MIRNGDSPPPEKEKIWQKTMGEVVAGPVGPACVDQASQTERYHSHAVTLRRQSGRPIANPTKFEMAVL